ncbi:MAG: matrixin family metalloprotease [Nitrosopumilaceae archaeon]
MKITIITISLMALLIFFPSYAKGSELTTINTFLPWKTQDKILQVSIIKETPLSPDQIESVKKAITGFGTIEFDDTITYVSWQEALKTTSEYKTKLSMPTIEMVSDNNEKADITIVITDEKDTKGYSGFTTHVLEDNMIVKSNITIYDINNITGEQISSITRHEFGHALGLAHADSPDDLMYDIVQVPSYVTDCDIDTLLALYDGNVKSPSQCGV